MQIPLLKTYSRSHIPLAPTHMLNAERVAHGFRRNMTVDEFP
jgi:hypothetical protein